MELLNFLSSFRFSLAFPRTLQCLCFNCSSPSISSFRSVLRFHYEMQNYRCTVHYIMFCSIFFFYFFFIFCLLYRFVCFCLSYVNAFDITARLFFRNKILSRYVNCVDSKVTRIFLEKNGENHKSCHCFAISRSSILITIPIFARFLFLLARSV